MSKKNHHYIPVFYQKQFSGNGRSIGKYLVKHDKYIESARIKRTGFKEYMYGKDTVIEDALMGIENEVAKVISSINSTHILPNYSSYEYHILLIFILIMEARVQKQAVSSNNILDEQMKVQLRMEIEHGKLDIPVESLDDVDISYNIPNLISIKGAFENYKIIEDLNCALIISDTDRDFITSDNPVVRYNYMYNVRNYTLRNYGLGNMGFQMFFPISSKCCIYLYDGVLYDTDITQDGNIHLTKGRHVENLNKLFYKNSFDFLLFNSYRIKEKDIKRFTIGLNLNNNKKEIVTLGNKESKIIITGFKSVKDFISFPFLRINKKFINMPLPAHLAGPIRPRAKKHLN